MFDRIGHRTDPSTCYLPRQGFLPFFQGGTYCIFLVAFLRIYTRVGQNGEIVFIVNSTPVYIPSYEGARRLKKYIPHPP